ncbi:hypothetical protein PRIPAC_75801 [Pristionchus pacificus]|uniref:Uncharacterized protein n=1 Tax=Pristionchus pacificus TaxID=54126 RepID=A0A2A6CRD7_PRIPA|nr:hypothetical protein PRIPAC_75801 [Pristionchus pacificus]|eukprot:PDM80765.1 hypothetical protein PRIPAC_35768 [Pristionchus pacificus]
MSSPPRPFCLSPTPSLSPIRFGSPRCPSPYSRPNSELDRTQRELFLDSRPSSPTDTVLNDTVFNNTVPGESTVPSTPQDRNDTLFGDGVTVPNTPENFNVSWDENAESTTPLATIINTPKRFIKASSMTSSSSSSSSSSPTIVKRRRLNFPDAAVTGEDSDSRDANDEKDSDSSSQGFASDDKEADSSPRANEEVIIRPLSKEELFFTVRRSKNFTYFLAPFATVPLLVKIKYPPREDQISTLLSHGFEYARNLNDKQRFRNISFRYELSCSIDRRRQLIRMALGRLERLIEDTQGDDNHLTLSVQRRENVRLKTLRRELIDEERDYDSHTSFESESDTRAEVSTSDQSDRCEEETLFNSIRKKPKHAENTPNRPQKNTVNKKATASNKSTVPQKVTVSKTTPVTKKSAQKKKSFSWTNISQFVKSPLSMLNRK